MPKIYPIQSSFSTGELTPLFNSQVTTDAYKKSVEVMENFMPSTHGPAVFRSGIKYHDTVPGDKGRVFIFDISVDESYVVVISDNGKLYITPDVSGLLGEQIVTNPDFDSGMTGWTNVSVGQGTAMIVDSDLVLTPGSSESHYAAVEQEVNTPFPAYQHLLHIASPNNDGFRATVNIGTTPGDSDIVQLHLDGEHAAVYFTPVVSTFYVQVFRYNTSGGTVSKVISLVKISYIIPASGTMTSFNHPWDKEELSEIQAKMPPGGIDRMYFVHRGHPQQVLSHITGVWDFIPIVYTAPPTAWATGNYPGAIAFFEGRVWYGGTYNEPETFWASVSGSYEDMTIGSTADDALEFEMAKRGPIVWLQGLNNLLLGTEVGEHIITSEGGVITPGDIQVKQQSAYGSKRVQPLDVGNWALYSSLDGKKLRDISYKWTEEKWMSRDISFTAEHYLAIGAIEEIAWAQDPSNHIFIVALNGVSYNCVYDPTNDIVGWSKLTTQGAILSSGVMRSRRGSILVTLTSRYNDEMYVEFNNPGDAYMDSWKEEHSDVPKNTIDDGLHLRDKEVQVTVDGAYHPPVTLSDTGTATLEFSGYHIMYGLQYIGKLKTNALAFTLPEGSAQSMKKRFNKITTRLISSVNPKINGFRPPTRYPSTPMGTREPNKSKDLSVTNLGWGETAKIEILHDLPYACTITGIFGEAALEVI